MAERTNWKFVLPSLLLFTISIASGVPMKLHKADEITQHADLPDKGTKSSVQDFFWEVTDGPSAFLDGNHPSLHAVVTHEQVDKSFGKSSQTKRVKKILPPYPHGLNDVKNSSDAVSEVEISSPPPPPTPITPSAESSNKVAQLEASNITVESREENEKGGIIPEPNFKNFTYETEGKMSERENFTNGVHLESDESKGDKPQSTTATNPSHLAVERITGVKQDSEVRGMSNEKTENQKEIFNNKSGDENPKEKTLSETINMQNASFSRSFPDREDGETTTEAVPSGPSSGRMKEVDVAPDLRSSKTTTALEEEDIEGIKLVPDEDDVDIFPEDIKPTTERTIWDLIQQRDDDFAKDEVADDEPRALPYKTRQESTQKPLYGNFDAESAEVEYESENFRHGFSNIEKHELPYSYALPWLQVKDVEPRKKMVHTKINDFPNIIPINKNHFEAMNTNEEMQIPQDISKLLQLSKLSETERGLGGVTLSILETGGGGGSDASHDGRRSKWYLLLLTGNSTIIKLRRRDFTKYLKLNLAARLSVEYDDVTVNRVILAPPKVLVNVSVYATSDDIAEESQFDLRDKEPEGKGDAPLSRLAETNATLLELSGEEYHVVRFMSLQPQPEAQAQRDVPSYVSITSRHDDIEFVIYTFLGSACACVVILTIFLGISKYYKKLGECHWPWNRPKIAVWSSSEPKEEDNDEYAGLSPAVIYSGGFPQVRGSWMTSGGQQTQQPVLKGSLLQRYPGIELGVAAAPDPCSDVSASPRHNKVRMYNCGASRVLIPRPLDVRIPQADSN